MNRQSTDAKRQARDKTRTWNNREIEGDRSMKSTLSSANQWNDFRNSRSVNNATNFGEKSSLQISINITVLYIQYSAQLLYMGELKLYCRNVSLVC